MSGAVRHDGVTVLDVLPGELDLFEVGHSMAASERAPMPMACTDLATHDQGQIHVFAGSIT